MEAGVEKKETEQEEEQVPHARKDDALAAAKEDKADSEETECHNHDLKAMPYPPRVRSPRRQICLTPQLIGGFAPQITVVRGRLFGEAVEAGFDSLNFGHVSAAQDRALVHVPNTCCEVVGVGRQHQEAHRCQHSMSFEWL